MSTPPRKHQLETDLTEQALNRRLQKLGDLYRLGCSLRKAGSTLGPRLVREKNPFWPKPEIP